MEVWARTADAIWRSQPGWNIVSVQTGAIPLQWPLIEAGSDQGGKGKERRWPFGKDHQDHARSASEQVTGPDKERRWGAPVPAIRLQPGPDWARTGRVPAADSQ